MRSMNTLLAGHQFERIPQIDPDQINTMEDVIAAITIIHDELNVKDPVAVLIKNELMLYKQVLTKISSTYQTVKLFVLLGMSKGAPMPGSPEYEIENIAGRVGSLSYIFSAHATWEISQENKNELAVLTAAGEKLRSILAQTNKNPMQYMCKILKTAASYDPSFKTFIDYAWRDGTENYIIPAAEGAKVLVPRRLEFFDAVQNFNPEQAFSETRVIDALNNLVSVLAMCCRHLNIRKEETPWEPQSKEMEAEERAARLGLDITEYREFCAKLIKEDSLKDSTLLSYDMSSCARIDDPILQKFMSNVLQNVTLCLSLKLLFNKNKEYPFSGLLLEHINLAIDRINENHTVQGLQKQYNVPTQHGEYRAWLEKSKLPLMDNKDLMKWDGVHIGKLAMK